MINTKEFNAVLNATPVKRHFEKACPDTVLRINCQNNESTQHAISGAINHILKELNLGSKVGVHHEVGQIFVQGTEETVSFIQNELHVIRDNYLISVITSQKRQNANWFDLCVEVDQGTCFRGGVFGAGEVMRSLGNITVLDTPRPWDNTDRAMIAANLSSYWTFESLKQSTAFVNYIFDTLFTQFYEVSLMDVTDEDVQSRLRILALSVIGSVDSHHDCTSMVASFTHKMQNYLHSPLRQLSNRELTGLVVTNASADKALQAMVEAGILNHGQLIQPNNYDDIKQEEFTEDDFIRHVAFTDMISDKDPLATLIETLIRHWYEEVVSEKRCDLIYTLSQIADDESACTVNGIMDLISLAGDRIFNDVRL